MTKRRYKKLKGKWTMSNEVNTFYDLPSYECSKCKRLSLEHGDYCPHCGCRMYKEEDQK